MATGSPFATLNSCSSVLSANATCPSEVKFQRELDLSGAVREARQASEARHPGSQREGRRKLSLVEEVKELRAKLKTKPLVAGWQNFLEQREIKIIGRVSRIADSTS